MADIYTEAQGIASGLFAEFKQGIILFVAVTPGGGQGHNPGPSSQVQYTLPGAVARGPEFKFLTAGLAVASDKQINSSVDPRFNPKDYPAGRMIVDGVEYKIKQFMAVPAAGTPVAWKFILGK